MTRSIGRRILFTIFAALFWVSCPVAANAEISSSASEKNPGAKTLSPYFFVKTDDLETDQLPLKSTTADVRIAGVIAEVTVTQLYINEGQHPLEAVYVFPGSTRAAVHGLKMVIGERIVEADIMERQKARDTYEQAKSDGKTASLLEQHRPNVFQMNVANILPGDRVQVVLSYTELIEPTDQIYEFVYPAVVGPRYSEKSETDPAGQWIASPYGHSGEKAPYAFDLKVEIVSGITLAEISSPSHAIEVNYSSPNRAAVIPEEGTAAGTRDFILRYRLAGDTIQTGLLLYPDEKANYFLAMLEPPARVARDSILPREYIFIIDVSGSMNGFPLEDVAKPMIRKMIGGLDSQDYINMLFFAGGSEVLSPSGSLPVNETNRIKALNWINSASGSGGTRLLPALNQALTLPRTSGVSRIVVVITDGYVDVEPEAFDTIRKRLGEGSLFAFGIGSSVNRFLIEGMARAGQGQPFIVTRPEEGPETARKFRDYINSPVLTNIALRFDEFDAYDIEPVAVPDLFAKKPVMVIGKYRGELSGKIIVTGDAASGRYETSLKVDHEMESTANAALKRLWARHRIASLSDMNLLQNDPDRVAQVTNLGLEYSLLTQYTSFVAVDNVRRGNGELVTVKQPLPLPDGVSDLAVGQAAGSYARTLKVQNTVAAETMAGSHYQSPAAPHVEGQQKDEDSRQQKTGRRLAITAERASGGISVRQAEKVLTRYRERLEACVAGSAVYRSGKRVGELSFELTIGQGGMVEHIRSVSSGIQDKSLEICLERLIESLRFSGVGKPGKVLVRIQLGRADK